MKLSIITPYYKTYEYTKHLAEHLTPQLTDEVEWIIIDDGCNERRLDDINAKVIHLSNNSGNASTPRNLGLFYAKGEYIAFIDSDDDITDIYVDKILDKIKEGFDYCYISWKCSNGYTCIINDKPPDWNTVVWNCVFNRKVIGNEKFNPTINYGEDKDFLMRLKDGVKTNIPDILYIYNIRSDSITKRFGGQEIKRKRPVEKLLIEKKLEEEVYL